MTDPRRIEYHASFVELGGDQDVNAHMAAWAAQGWELVSGSMATYHGESFTRPGQLGPQFLWVMYWRKGAES